MLIRERAASQNHCFSGYYFYSLDLREPLWLRDDASELRGWKMKGHSKQTNFVLEASPCSCGYLLAYFYSLRRFLPVLFGAI